MQMSTNSISKKGTTRRLTLMRFVTSRWFIILIAVIFVLGSASIFREYARSNALKERLIGTWTLPTYVGSGSFETWIFEFRRDGTIRYHPPGKPEPETGRIGDYWRWKITGGDLVIVYDTHISPDAPAGRKLIQFGRSVADRIHGDDYPLVTSDRYSIQDNGGDTITFILRPGGASSQPQKFTMTRVSADNH